MATTRGILRGLTKTSDLSKFLANPKKYVVAQGLDADDPNVAAQFETYARALINNINAANSTVGSGQVRVQWGIGCACCNAETLRRVEKPTARSR